MAEDSGRHSSRHVSTTSTWGVGRMECVCRVLCDSAVKAAHLRPLEMRLALDYNSWHVSTDSSHQILPFHLSFPLF